MMYSQKFCVAVKCNGKVLRELGDSVHLPFGSEFSLLLKNLSSVRAEARVTIDGQDVLGGRSLVVNANSEIELERFVNDLSTGNRFRFIERTEQIENYRGIRADDGIVRVEWQFEKVYVPAWPNPVIGSPYPPYNPDWYSRRKINTERQGTWCGPQLSTGSPLRTASYSVSCNSVSPASVCDAGITVPGSRSDQHFHETSGFICEETKHCIVLRLVGKTDNARVSRPVTVKSKPKCTTCGRVNKATAKFCTNCGTALAIV